MYTPNISLGLKVYPSWQTIQDIPFSSSISSNLNAVFGFSFSSSILGCFYLPRFINISFFFYSNILFFSNFSSSLSLINIFEAFSLKIYFFDVIKSTIISAYLPTLPAFIEVSDNLYIRVPRFKSANKSYTSTQPFKAPRTIYRARETSSYWFYNF